MSTSVGIRCRPRHLDSCSTMLPCLLKSIEYARTKSEQTKKQQSALLLTSYRFVQVLIVHWQFSWPTANNVQEVAGNHGVALWGRTEEGFATDPVMVAMHLIFAATRIQIEMKKYPKW